MGKGVVTGFKRTLDMVECHYMSCVKTGKFLLTDDVIQRGKNLCTTCCLRAWRNFDIIRASLTVCLLLVWREKHRNPFSNLLVMHASPKHSNHFCKLNFAGRNLKSKRHFLTLKTWVAKSCWCKQHGWPPLTIQLIGLHRHWSIPRTRQFP